MNILAIGCHPDDVEICCAGTLAKCVKRGDKVTVAHLCTGSLGHVVIPPEELVPIRAAEAREAGKLAGIEVLDGVFGDLDIYADNAESRNKVVEIIQYAQPERGDADPLTAEFFAQFPQLLDQIGRAHV